MSDRDLVARAIADTEKPNGFHLTAADRVLAALSAAGRLRAEVTGEVVEAVENVMLRYDADMKLGDNADACRDDLVALVSDQAADSERRVRGEHLTQIKAGRIACFVDDRWGGYWQTGEGYTFRLHPYPLAELRDAVAFLDKVRVATLDEQIAVGTDAADRLEKAARDVVSLWPKGS